MMAGDRSQGALANLSGRVFERMMEPVFEANGFPVLTEREFRAHPERYGGLGRYILRDAVYTTIYGHEGRTEFVIVDGERRIRVEAKFQSAPGSVDEKFPYMMLNGIYRYPEDEVVFVVDGGGYRAGARAWLEDRIDGDWLRYREEHGKRMRLMSITEFMDWFNHGLPAEVE